jgi:tRNA A37 methylthiotransferase MiaB
VDAVALKRNQALEGTIQEILVETSDDSRFTIHACPPKSASGGRRREPRLTGRTRTNKIVKFKGTPGMIGKLVRVKIEKAESWILEAVIL